MLHSLVCSVEKAAAAASGFPLLLRCKNFQVLQFVIPGERECHDVQLSLQRLSQPGELYLQKVILSSNGIKLHVCRAGFATFGALQRATQSCTASPTSLTPMGTGSERSGTFWTSRLSTGGWGCQTLCGNSPPSTDTIRSAS